VRKPQTTQYVVYFGHNSAALDDSGKFGIEFIKGEVKKGAKVSVAAFTDRSGSAEYNKVLAAKRAKAVFSALEKSGIKAEIATTIYGEERNAVVTKDGVRQRLNRRVEISVTQ
jgi:outer membrane protein OmpA-like peptidoglycan-associated protein